MRLDMPQERVKEKKRTRSPGIGPIPMKGQAPIGMLLETFHDHDGPGKEQAIVALREADDSLVYPPLESALRNNANDLVRNAAMELYVALRGRSLPHLVVLLSDSNEEVRTFSGVMLGTIKDSGAVPALITALADPDMNVKHAAAEALGRICDRRAVDPLIEALATDMWLQFPAAIALGDIGDSRAVGPLVALLTMPGANVPAIQALGKLAHPLALIPLVGFLEDEEPALREWALEAVVETLSRNSSAAIPALSKKAKNMLLESLTPDRPNVRKNAVTALGYYRVREAVPALRSLLTDADLSEAARMSLARIEDA
jgi:HEAT repeat protein